jgi:DNA-binding MarR family transcriptional regulator
LTVWRHLLQYHRRTVHALDEELRAARGLDLDEYDVLVQLAEAPPEGMRMGDLAAATLIARSSCTRLVDRLVRAGLVQRSSDRGDRRTVVVALTADGRAVLRRAALTHLDGVAARFADRLAPEDVAVLGRILARLDPAG